ncbi:MAG: 4-alpha-glucanotransferase [Pseudomonadota bacterium]
MAASSATLARQYGLISSYKDVLGRRISMRAATRDALLGAMGAGAVPPPRQIPDYVIATPGEAPNLDLSGAWALTLENGQMQEGRGPLPPLDLGRHRVEAGGETCWLIVAPAALALPEKTWGVTAPLYALQGRARGGIGSYSDLAVAAEALAGVGAQFLGINPVHAGFPGDPAAFSPYSPSHRRRLSVQHVRFEGEAEVPPADLIDYPAARTAHRAAAEAAFATREADPAFDAWRAEEGPSLERFATYEALAERFGPYWGDWPAEMQSPDTDEVRRFAAAEAHRITYHVWLQYLADRQLAEAAEAAHRAGMRHGLYLDLAVGTHPHGAETWSESDAFAQGVSLGAPPDAFATDGQRWNLAPFNPRALIQTGFEALASTLRCQLRHARLLRIDHILGFERAFWVPEGGVPGGYVRMPRDAMLAVVRLEAARAGATIVGEDLGNIPHGLRGALAASGILSCRVAMFEGGRAAEDYPEAALASFGTHDLPTWAGWRQGADIALRDALGSIDAEAAAQAQRDRAADVARLDAATGDTSGAVDAMHRFLAETPARLVALQIEDILGIAEQPNLPGTVDEYPNWRRTLPVAAGDLGEDPKVQRAAAVMRRAGR